MPLVELFASTVNVATQDLELTSDFATIKSILLSLTNANRPEDNANMLIVYLSQFDSVFNFVNSWNTLDKKIKQSILNHCLEQLQLKEADVDTLFSFPIQHISRLQLHLGTMAKILGQHKNDAELSMIAKRFEETSKKLQEKIEEFNSRVSDAHKAPNLNTAAQSTDIEKGFVFV